MQLPKSTCLALFLFAVLSCTLSQAQDKRQSIRAAHGFYLECGTGYGIRTTSTDIKTLGLARIAPYYPEINPYTSYDKNFTLGTGSQAKGALGYMFNAHVGVELGVSYTTLNTVARSMDTELKIEHDNVQFNLKGYVVCVVPSVVLSTRIGLFHPFAKIGLELGQGFISERAIGQTSTSPDWQPISVVFTERYHRGLTTGPRISVGNGIRLSHCYSLIQEIAYTAANYVPGEADITNFIRADNGMSLMLRGAPIKHVYTFMSKSDLQKYPDNTNDPTQTNHVAKIRFPFSNIAFMIGLKFRI